jgi:hypothetical protein
MKTFFRWGLVVAGTAVIVGIIIKARTLSEVQAEKL